MNLTKIQETKMPVGIKLVNETDFELTDNEIIVLLSILKSFRVFIDENGITTNNKFGAYYGNSFPALSSRLYLDFGLYSIPSDAQTKDVDECDFVVYICNFTTKTLSSKIKTFRY